MQESIGQRGPKLASCHLNEREHAGVNPNDPTRLSYHTLGRGGSWINSSYLFGRKPSTLSRDSSNSSTVALQFLQYHLYPIILGAMRRTHNRDVILANHADGPQEAARSHINRMVRKTSARPRIRLLALQLSRSPLPQLLGLSLD